MKTEITPKDYIDIYEACDWNPRIFSNALKAMRYSDELTVKGSLRLTDTPIQSLVNIKEVVGCLNLKGTPIQDLGNLQTVEGYLNLYETPIQSLGNLQTVERYLNLFETPIQSLGNLQKVGDWLDLRWTPFSKKYSKEDIRQIVKVKGNIYL